MDSETDTINFYLEKIQSVYDTYYYMRPDYGWEKMKLELR
jgi:hypothetical protein